jgi:hypothetical protein
LSIKKGIFISTLQKEKSVGIGRQFVEAATDCRSPNVGLRDICREVFAKNSACFLLATRIEKFVQKPSE